MSIEIKQFPHCDQRILHTPGECEYCDRHPDWQALREAWGINFTGQHKEKDEYGNRFLPCPAEANRPLQNMNMWDGNAPIKHGDINKTSLVYPKDADVSWDSMTRHVHIETETHKCPCCDHGQAPDVQMDEWAIQLDRAINEIKAQLDSLGRIVKRLIR